MPDHREKFRRVSTYKNARSFKVHLDQDSEPSLVHTTRKPINVLGIKTNSKTNLKQKVEPSEPLSLGAKASRPLYTKIVPRATSTPNNSPGHDNIPFLQLEDDIWDMRLARVPEEHISNNTLWVRKLSQKLSVGDSEDELMSL
ncbi:hypothetical protein NEOLI_000229 [Neolecta irregularis DAH-3]|uniref:Uncharacterized protein n=1 Tax=Neolecta irregularis (strain DAH-3) TaxID=1198029 RepID=A0A1U7LJV3_NEOID|nr:hypothetical protein NEOLI_000229 [Neolecta irregularis DAH-3]|eukprot:OLL22924.1 hypothetical protein NEOLI_000229 [Neolecta irregularis DAH-3]